jgi:hypothetical protein
MKKSILVYGAIIGICFGGCYIGGFAGGVIFGLGTTISLTSTIGYWQYKKALGRQEKLMNAIVKTKITIND